MRNPLLSGPRLFVCAALLSLLAFLGAACGGEEGQEQTDSSPTPVERPVEKVTFMAGFKAQANLPFVGVYVAQEKGFFREQGLEVEVQHSDGSQHIQLLAAGRVQFATADAAQVLRRRAEDPVLPLLAIALIGQTGQQGWVSLADSGINEPKDWVGKTVGFRNTIPPDFYAILQANGVDPAGVNTVNIQFQPPQLLVEGRVDVYPVFLSNEPDTIRRKLGREVNVFRAADYGVPTLGLTYITSEDFAAEKPDVVERFLKAALRGIEYAIDNREEAVQIVLKFAPQEEAEHQRFMMDTEIDGATSTVTEENGLGWQTAGQWQALEDSLLPFGALAGPADVDTVFTDRFLKAVFRDGELVWP